MAVCATWQPGEADEGGAGRRQLPRSCRADNAAGPALEQRRIEEQHAPVATRGGLRVHAGVPDEAPPLQHAPACRAHKTPFDQETKGETKAACPLPRMHRAPAGSAKSPLKQGEKGESKAACPLLCMQGVWNHKHTRKAPPGWKAMQAMCDLGLCPQHTTLCTLCPLAAAPTSLPRQAAR
jgi:hypothetical protein